MKKLEMLKVLIRNLRKHRFFILCEDDIMFLKGMWIQYGKDEFKMELY